MHVFRFCSTPLDMCCTAVFVHRSLGLKVEETDLLNLLIVVIHEFHEKKTHANIDAIGWRQTPRCWDRIENLAHTNTHYTTTVCTNILYFNVMM